MEFLALPGEGGDGRAAGCDGDGVVGGSEGGAGVGQARVVSVGSAGGGVARSGIDDGADLLEPADEPESRLDARTMVQCAASCAGGLPDGGELRLAVGGPASQNHCDERGIAADGAGADRAAD